MSDTHDNTSGVPLEFFYCVKNIPTKVILIQVGMSICFFLGTPAHCWLLWLSLRTGWKIKPTQVFSLMLTVMDLLFCLDLCFEAINVLTIQNAIVKHVSLFIFGVSWGCRLLIQVCICIEQYLAVIHPITFLSYKDIEYRIAPAANVWLVSSGYGLYLCIANVDFPDCIYLSACCIELVVISFCCMSVLRALKHSGPGEGERGRDVGNQQKRKAFNAISTVLLTVLLSYLPLTSVTIYHLTKHKELFDCDIVFLMFSFDVYCVMFRPLLKLYQEGYLKDLHVFFSKLFKLDCF